MMLTFMIERKALEQSLIDEDDEEDDDDGKYLNLEGEDDGDYNPFPFFPLCSTCRTEDVWDDDSAYLEMLANEVRSSRGCATEPRH